MEIDFGEKTFFPPFSILFIATKLKYIKSKNPLVHIGLKNHRRHEYLTHMGFFNLFSPSFGQVISEFGGGGPNYLPITCLKRDSLYEKPTDKYHEFQDLIQLHADRLAGLMLEIMMTIKRCLTHSHILFVRRCVMCSNTVRQTLFIIAPNTDLIATRLNLLLLTLASGLERLSHKILILDSTATSRLLNIAFSLVCRGRHIYLVDLNIGSTQDMVCI